VAKLILSLKVQKQRKRPPWRGTLSLVFRACVGAKAADENEVMLDRDDFAEASGGAEPRAST